MVDSQMDSTLLSDLVKYCGVFEDVILHEVSLMSFGRYQYWRYYITHLDWKYGFIPKFIYALYQATDFSYPRLATLEITVHQLILTYNASKTSDQRNSSIRRNHSFQDNDNQEEKGKEKLEVSKFTCWGVSIYFTIIRI